MEKDLIKKVGEFENNTTEVFRVVFERLDRLENNLPTHLKNRKKIGLFPKDRCN